MMSRRNALLAGIGLAGIAAYARNLFALGAHVGAEKARIGRDLFRSEDDPPAAKPATPLSEASCHSSG